MTNGPTQKQIEDARRRGEIVLQQRLMKPLVALGLRKLAEVGTQMASDPTADVQDLITGARGELLVEAVCDGGLCQEVAEELAAEEGLDLDAPA